MASPPIPILREKSVCFFVSVSTSSGHFVPKSGVGRGTGAFIYAQMCIRDRQTHLSKSALGSYEAEDFKDISHHALIQLAKFYDVTVDLSLIHIYRGLTSIEKIRVQTIEYIEEKVETYDNYRANDKTKSLVHLLDKAPVSYTHLR